MSRWTNTRPMFRVVYTFESETMDAFVRDYRDATERAQRAEARVRELEEAQGELLGLLDLTDHSPPCDESCSSWIEWGECTCGRAGSVRR